MGRCGLARDAALYGVRCMHRASRTSFVIRALAMRVGSAVSSASYVRHILEHTSASGRIRRDTLLSPGRLALPPFPPPPFTFPPSARPIISGMHGCGWWVAGAALLMLA
eukprot:scaffold1916_cov123-Isochrysis_galbana.AAC.15